MPSFITTLGMYLILVGAVYLWSDGAPKGGLSEEFRRFGRRAFEDVPLLGRVPYALLVLLASPRSAVLLMRSDFGRTLVAVGDNPRTAELSGVRVLAYQDDRLRPQRARRGGGGDPARRLQRRVVPGRRRAWSSARSPLSSSAGWRSAAAAAPVVGAMLGALTLETLFALMNFYGVSGALKSTVQGGIILSPWRSLRCRASAVQIKGNP